MIPTLAPLTEQEENPTPLVPISASKTIEINLDVETENISETSTFSTAPVALPASEASQEDPTRFYAFREIVTTEQSYVNQLDRLIKVLSHLILI